MRFLNKIFGISLFIVLFLSCNHGKSDDENAEQDPLKNYINKNMISIEGGTVNGKTQDSYDFGTKEEFWYGVFTNNRTVTLSPYNIFKYETTWVLWNEVKERAKSLGYVIAGEGQSGSDDAEDNAKQPVTNISWYDAVVWCNALTEIFYGSTNECAYLIENEVAKDSSNEELCQKITFDTSKKGFRLPTEAEWEVAARLEKEKTEYTTNYGTEEKPIYLININHLSGAKGDFNDVDECNEVAWNKNNSVNNSKYTTSIVGKLRQNGIGAFDMAGNVAEWCYDYHGKIEEESVKDPIGATTGKWKISRGGYMKAAPIYCLSSYRCFLAQKANFISDDMGFRIASYK